MPFSFTSFPVEPLKLTFTKNVPDPDLIGRGLSVMLDSWRYSLVLWSMYGVNERKADLMLCDFVHPPITNSSNHGLNAIFNQSKQLRLPNSSDLQELADPR